MSQPAVSSALARLRKAFDDPLFVRTAHGMEPSSSFQHGLLTAHVCCLLRADDPITSKRLSLKQSLGLKHVVVHAEGRSQELVERFLARNKLRPTVVLVTPHFMSLPMIIA